MDSSTKSKGYSWYKWGTLPALVSFWVLFYAIGFQLWQQWIPHPEEDDFNDFTKKMFTNLRRVDNFQWYIIPVLTTTMGFYFNAAAAGNWGCVWGGLAFLGMDAINEILNTVFLCHSRTSAVWTTPGDSVFILLPGWNAEILLMFAMVGVFACRVLPENKHGSLFGFFNYRWILAFVLSLVAVVVEVGLNLWDALPWHYDWWSLHNVPQSLVPLFFFGYFHFFVTAFHVHDMCCNALRVCTVLFIWGVAGGLAWYFRACM